MFDGTCQMLQFPSQQEKNQRVKVKYKKKRLSTAYHRTLIDHIRFLMVARLQGIKGIKYSAMVYLFARKI